jgi:hypothetical protein
MRALRSLQVQLSRTAPRAELLAARAEAAAGREAAAAADARAERERAAGEAMRAELQASVALSHRIVSSSSNRTVLS